MGLLDTEIGIILRPFDTTNRLFEWKPHLSSLRFPTEEFIDPFELDENDFYHQDLGFLEAEYIDEFLEDLQCVHGLRALHVKVVQNPSQGWDPKCPYFTLSPNSQSL